MSRCLAFTQVPGWNSGPYACSGNTLPTEPSSQPLETIAFNVVFLMLKNVLMFLMLKLFVLTFYLYFLS